MNVSTHQKKEKNQKTRMGKREAGEERRQATDFKEAVLLRSFRGQHGETLVCARGVPAVTGIFGKANSHFDSTQMGSETAPPR